MKKYVLTLICCGVLLSGCASQSERWQENIMQEDIVIDGISGDYELLFVTDAHAVIPLDTQEQTDAAEETEQIQNYAQERYKGFLGEDGTSSAEQFSRVVDYANEEEVDGVLLGGDIIDSPSRENLDFLSKELSELEMPYLYTLGNHDWTFPWEYMSESGKQKYLPALSPYMEGDTSFHTLDFGEFVVAAVDNSSGQVNPEVLDDYSELLDTGKPVIVLAHVPFLTQSVLSKATQVWNSGVVIGGGNFGGIYPNEASEEFVEMTTAEDSPVVAVLAGHVHFYDKDVIEGEKDVLQIVGDAGFRGSVLRLRILGRS